MGSGVAFSSGFRTIPSIPATSERTTPTLRVGVEIPVNEKMLKDDAVTVSAPHT